VLVGGELDFAAGEIEFGGDDVEALDGGGLICSARERTPASSVRTA